MKKTLLFLLFLIIGITQTISQDFARQIETFGESGAYEKADSIYALASQQINYTNHPLQTLDLNLSYAIYLNAQGRSEESYPLMKQASEVIQNITKRTLDPKNLEQIKNIKSRITYEMAYSLWLAHKNQQAREVIDEAIAQSSMLQDLDLLSEAYNLAGAIYRRLFMLDKSIGFYQQSLKIAEDREDYSLASIIISNISILYNEIEETGKAVEISRKLFSYPIQDTLSMEHHLNRITFLCNHGILLTNAHQLQNARDTFLLAEKAMNKQTPGGLKFYVYTQCGRILRDLGNSQEGIQYYQKALSYRNQSKNQNNKANLDYLYGYALFHDTDSILQAEHYTLKAVNFYRQHDSLNIMFPKSLLLLSEIEARKGNLSNSAKLVHKAYEKELALQKEKYHKRLAGFEAELKTQEKTLEITRLNEKRAVEKMTYRIHTYTITGILLLTILLSIILSIHMRKRKIAFRLKQTELEGKIKEKEAQSRILASEMNKKMTDQYIRGLEDSNNRISKELHDGVCNELLSIYMQLEHSNPQQLSEQLNHIREDIRNLSHQLSVPIFEHINLYDMLQLYIKKLHTLEKPQLHAYISEEVKLLTLPSEKIVEVYRIIQEAVSNTIKHAYAQHMYLTVSKQGNNIEIIFEDDGKGFDMNLLSEDKLTAGLGLKSIKERSHKLQGDCKIETVLGKGTILHVQFPI